jgi:hypothetical protein
MVRDTLTSLDALAVARQQVHTGVPGDPAEIPKTVKHPGWPGRLTPSRPRAMLALCRAF